mgnify:CR=1 FL=1
MDSCYCSAITSNTITGHLSVFKYVTLNFDVIRVGKLDWFYIAAPTGVAPLCGFHRAACPYSRSICIGKRCFEALDKRDPGYNVIKVFYIQPFVNFSFDFGESQISRPVVSCIAGCRCLRANEGACNVSFLGRGQLSWNVVGEWILIRSISSEWGPIIIGVLVSCKHVWFCSTDISGYNFESKKDCGVCQYNLHSLDRNLFF